MKINQISLQGKIKRIDYKFNKTKDGREFVSASFTLCVNENEIRVESFSMRYKKDGNELSSYQGLVTLFNEAKCLHKTVKRANMEKAEVVEDETIVENIEDADALDCGNYKVRYTKFEENSYEREGQVVKNTRIQTTYPRRVDFEKTEYTPKADFEIAGKVKTSPCVLEKVDGTEYMQFVVTVPEYVEAWGDRPEQVKLQDIIVTSYDKDAWEYIEDNFTMGSFAYLNGEIVRKVTRVEAPTIDDEGRGFGRRLKQEPNYKTEVDERFEIMGGYVLESDEIELEKAFDEELWSQAEQQQSQPQQEKTTEVKKSWGREKDVVSKNSNVPF